MSQICAGTCLLLSKPNRYAIEHLWIVVTEPDGNPQQVVMVNLTSERAGSDSTVTLSPGDHSFITKKTVVNYSDARLVETGNLIALVALNREAKKDDCNAALLARIQQGMLVSEFTPNKIKSYCQPRFQS